MKNSYILIYFVLLVGLLPRSVFAATLNFNPASAVPPLANGFSTTLLINSENESLNAIEGTILVDKKLGDNITVSDSASVVTFWVKRPEFDPSTHSISFSGTIPGGFSGNNGILFSIISPSYTGDKFDKAMVATNLKGFINDGFGTPAQIQGAHFSLDASNVTIDDSIQSQLYLDDRRKDNIPPESFDPQVSRDDSVFGGAWFLSFATIDKQSGIDHFEVQESKSGEIQSNNWQTAESPYKLKDQTLSSYIFITAVDKQGNERIIKVFPKNSQGFWAKYHNDIFTVLGLIAILLIIVIGLRRQNKISTTPIQI